jgi:hypothetical protein
MYSQQVICLKPGETAPLGQISFNPFDHYFVAYLRKVALHWRLFRLGKSVQRWTKEKQDERHWLSA